MRTRWLGVSKLSAVSIRRRGPYLSRWPHPRKTGAMVIACFGASDANRGLHQLRSCLAKGTSYRNGPLIFSIRMRLSK